MRNKNLDNVVVDEYVLDVANSTLCQVKRCVHGNVYYAYRCEIRDLENPEYHDLDVCLEDVETVSDGDEVLTCCG